MEEMVLDFQTLVRKMRREAHYERGSLATSQKADAFDDIAMDIERILNKHGFCIPTLPGDVRGMGYRCSPITRFVWCAPVHLS